MKRKDVLLILPSYSVGGAEKVMLSYFNNFKNSSINLTLVFTNNKFKKKINNNKNIITLNYRRFLFCIPTLVRLINKNNINVVISSFPNISLVLLILRFLNIFKVKILIRQPNMIEESLNINLKLKLIRYLYKHFIKFTDSLIVTSRFMFDEAINNKVKEEKLHLITNPIDVNLTRRNINPIRTKGDAIKLIFVGRLVYQKGIDRLLNLLKNKSKLELLIVGEGVEKKKLISQSVKLGILDKVKFIGFKKNPFNYIAGADYLILPSRWEGLPNCVLESLSLGTPVISTNDVHALKDFSQNINKKSIFLGKNLNDLSEILDKIKKRSDYKNPRLRKSLLENFNTPKIFQKKINVIINTLND